MRKFKLEDNKFLAGENKIKGKPAKDVDDRSEVSTKFKNVINGGKRNLKSTTIKSQQVKYILKPKFIILFIGILGIIGGMLVIRDSSKQLVPSNAIYAQSSNWQTQYVVKPIIESITLDDYSNLEKGIIDRIGRLDDNYSVYVKDMYTGHEIFINAETDFPPASVYKVPLAMVVLKDIDDGVVTWDQELLVTAAEKPYTFDALSIRSGSYHITVEELLFYLITYSDNTAMTTLEHRLGGVDLLQERMKTEFGFENVTRDPHIANAVTFGRVFESLYNQEFLSKETNDYLIDLLKNVTSVHNDRIVAGLPGGIEAAHKIGTLVASYHDAGIVYGEERDYVLVILNKRIIPENAVKVVKDISRITYVGLN